MILLCQFEGVFVSPVYFKFIQQNVNGDKHFWTSQYSTSIHDTWAGLAFERVCLQHFDQIKKALGFSAVISTAHSWTHKPKDENDKGVQIDLLIDRNDDVINLCEMKYSKDEYLTDSDEDQRLRRRVSTFQREGHPPDDDHHLWHPTQRLCRRHLKPGHHERPVRGV